MARSYFRFQKLPVYQKARDLVSTLYVLSHALLQTHTETAELLRRHRLLIVVKIARGTGEPTRREAVQTFRQAARSAELCASVLQGLAQAGVELPEIPRAHEMAVEVQADLQRIAERIQSGARARDVFGEA